MIYNENTPYIVKFYTTGSASPVIEFIDSLPVNHQAKILKYIDFLRQHQGVLDEPYSKHIKGKMRELRVDFGKNRYRLFYFTFIHQTIVILHGFIKRTTQTPLLEIKIAEFRYQDVINYPNFYV